MTSTQTSAPEYGAFVKRIDELETQIRALPAQIKTLTEKAIAEYNQKMNQAAKQSGVTGRVRHASITE